ncbi:hypothetical protein SAMN05216299_10421 [Nitrosospira sp. Nsp14]|nr:hypothetical protein SAMN05216299_10421 [Nitrosospira sp. Nsp14]
MLRIINPRLREIKESDGKAMLAAMIGKLPENDRKTSRTCYTGPLNGSRSIAKTLARCSYYTIRLNLGGIAGVPKEIRRNHEYLLA